MSLFSGLQGSVHRSVGVDHRSKPGLLTVHQKLTKNSPNNPSADEVTDLCKLAIPVSDGSTLWFSSSTGKVWRELAGVWTYLFTTADTTGFAFYGQYNTSVFAIYAIHFLKSDGTRLYVLKNGDDDLQSYPLSRAWDITSVGTSDQSYTATQVTATGGYGLWLS